MLGTSFILLLTGSAPFIGARLTGLLSTIPLYTAILTVFAQRQQSRAGAVDILRGLLLGMFGFSAFYLTLALLLDRTGIVPAFLAAVVITLIVQGASFFVLRKSQS
ncbi:MAG: hypothetical protein NT121_10770 [Chloroflexi bacterium]|nr:hypothetical protein [Chloroflexota bacterium]